MKNFKAIASFLLTGLCIAMLSCNDPLQIGTEFLIENEVDFSSSDTFTVEAVTFQPDSTIAYRAADFNISEQRLGWITDPIFGNHKSTVATQLLPETFMRPEGTVDSVVFSMILDTTTIYGDPNASFDIRILSLFQDLSPSGTIYTDTVLATRNEFASLNGFRPQLGDSINIVEVNSTGGLDTIRVPSQLRVRMSDAIGNLLISLDSILYTEADTFLSAFPGLVIEPITMNNAFLPLRTAPNARNKLTLYYKDNAEISRQYNYPFGGATFSYHEHDYSMGTVDGFIDNPTASKDLLFIQGSGGPSISVKFPYLEALKTATKDLIINEAFLEFTTEQLPGDNREFYPLPSQIYASHEIEGQVVLIQDVVTAAQQFRDPSLFGGMPVEETVNGTEQIVYRMNISNHLQRMIRGEVSNELIIRLALNSTGPERVVFSGFNDAETPVKLKITYTEI